MHAPRTVYRVLLSLFIVACIAPSAALAAQEGPLAADTAVNFTNDTNCPSNLSAWTNPTNAGAQDNTPATFSRVRVDPDEPVNGQTGCLRARDFGFTIPNGSIIDGVVGSVRVKYTDLSPSGTTGFINAHWKVFIVKGDGTTGSTDKATGTAITTTYQNLTFGANNNTWGESLTYSDVNDADFGFTFGVVGVDNAQAEVDSMQMTVYYTAPPTLSFASDDAVFSPISPVLCHSVLEQIISVVVSFSENVTGFDASDLQITNGSVVGGSFSNVSPSAAIFQLEADEYGEVSITVPAGAVTSTSTGLQNATQLSYYQYSEIHTWCCGGVQDGLETSLYWPLNETTGTTAADAIIDEDDLDTTAQDGTLRNFASPNSSWYQCPATVDGENLGSLAFDGSNDYVSYTGSTTFDDDDAFYVSLWAKSDDVNPSSAVLFQMVDTTNNSNYLTIMYRSDKTNKLHVSRSANGLSTAKISDTQFTLTEWNHILVQVNPGGIGDLFLNGESVGTFDGTVVSGQDADSITIGAGFAGASAFAGLIDEVAVQTVLRGNQTAAELAAGLAATKNTACSGGNYIITAVPAGGFSLHLITNESVNPMVTRQSGPVVVRLRKSGAPLLDATVSFIQNRSWTFVRANTDAASNKAFISFSGNNHGHIGSHTLYVPKGSTTAVRVCPHASSLTAITSDCANGVPFSGSFPQSLSVPFPSGTATVTASVQNFSGTDYWKLAGMLGSGGGGEEGGGGGGGGGGGDVPDMSTWAMIGIGTAGVLFLLSRRTHGSA